MSKNNNEPVVKNMKKSKNQSASKSLVLIIVALFFTLLIFAGLIYLNNYISEDISYTNTIVAKEDIPENLLITQETAPNYFQVVQRDTAILPEDYIVSLTDYIDRYTSYPISKNEIITDKDFKNIDNSNFENPVEVSLTVNNLGNAICGKLRAGDIININFQNNMGEEESLKDIVVTGAYDSTCVVIAANNPNANTTYITFNIESENESHLNYLLANCKNIRISRKIM